MVEIVKADGGHSPVVARQPAACLPIGPRPPEIHFPLAEARPAHILSRSGRRGDGAASRLQL